MKSNILTYTFVGAWEQPIFLLPAVPLFDNAFSRNLFGDPINTNSEWQPEGFVIAKVLNKAITHHVLISQTQFQITVSNLNEIADIYVSVIKEMGKIFSLPQLTPPTKFNSSFIKHSYTVDIEILDSINEKSGTWLANKFVNNALNKTDYSLSKISLSTIGFEITDLNNKTSMVVIQPRQGKDSGLYFKITVGYDNKTTDSFNQLILTEFNESINLINNNIIKLFINGQ